jgi:uncharacterized protein
MESDSSIEDYTVRVKEAWQVGQAGKNNGAVLFAFMAEHKLYLQVGYGLESVLPDATAKRIIEREIVPRFRAKDIDGGMTAAVNAMIAATKGEYQGTGRTVAERDRNASTGAIGQFLGPFLVVGLIIFCVAVMMIRFIIRAARNPTLLLNPQRRGLGTGNTWWMGGSGSGSSWDSGSSGGGGSDFSGGGGSGGGGGAGGSW